MNCDQTQSSSSTNNASHEASEQNNSTDVPAADSIDKAIQQRSYRLQELLESERVYVKDLEIVVIKITCR